MQNVIAFHQQFVTEDACTEYLERLRWPERPVCPHCDCTEVYRCLARPIFKCRDCKKQFSARYGTIFEASRLPLQKWFLVIFLLGAYKKGASSIQVAERLDITQKSAWHVLRRIRSILSADCFAEVTVDDFDTVKQHRHAPIKTLLSFDEIMKLIVEAA